MTDTELLRQYVRQDSNQAFAALVARHINLVYSAALRKTGNAAAAEEITQAVFVILARKAAGLPRTTVLSGWLYQTARLTAANFLRTDIRRARREQEAYMQSLSNETESEVWPQIVPLLEDAMGRLGEKDRNAIALRFFEGRSFQEVGAALGASENAAKKRVAYALEKLRHYFSKHGVDSTTALIAGAISAHSVQAAPAALAKSVTAIAITKGAAAGGSALALIKGALKVMAWTKAKTAVVVGAGILLAAGTTTVTVNHIQAVMRNEAVAAESWRTLNLNAKLLEQAPPQARILPTKFPGQNSRELRLRGNGPNRRAAGIAVTVSQLVSAAYYGGGTPVTAGAPSRTVFSEAEPEARYDFICTVPGDSGAALQRELKQQLGLVGHRETRGRDVLLLQVHHLDAPGLKPNPHVAASHGSETPEGMAFVAGRLSTLAGLIENIVGVPVLDQTGTSDTFDITLKMNPRNHDPELLKQALLDQLGLELVPSREPVEVLVVDKGA